MTISILNQLGKNVKGRKGKRERGRGRGRGKRGKNRRWWWEILKTRTRFLWWCERLPKIDNVFINSTLWKAIWIKISMSLSAILVGNKIVVNCDYGWQTKQLKILHSKLFKSVTPTRCDLGFVNTQLKNSSKCLKTENKTNYELEFIWSLYIKRLRISLFKLLIIFEFSKVKAVF